MPVNFDNVFGVHDNALLLFERRTQLIAENIANVQQRAKHQIKMLLLDGMSNRVPARRMASILRDEMTLKENSVLNYDWERIAVTETNTAANNAVLASMKPDEYVIGNSHVDACPSCMKYINNKVYKVTDDPPPDPMSLKSGSKAYEKALTRWENEVWVGKSNYGRSVSPKKRTPEGLTPRDPAEMSMPTLSMHPQCRCRWSKFLPHLYYVKDGRVEFAVDKKTKAEQKAWLKQNPHILTTGAKA